METTTMKKDGIKLVMCLTRREGTTRAEFQDYWLNSHAKLWARHAGAYRSKRYVQAHTVETALNEGLRASRGMGPAYDGVAEVWFESEAALMEAMGTAEGEAASTVLLADEGTFIDHSRSVAFIVEEHEL